MTIVLAILLLCLLVTVHEFGHFVAARLTGIPVSEFAVGMGPKLVGWKSRKYDTRFSVRVFPLGGYCAFVGEDDVQDKEKDNPDAYNRQALWKRLITVLMGPVMNFVLAFVVAICFFSLSPVYDVSPVQILAVDANGPAAAAGLQVGDQILMVGGAGVSAEDPQSTIDALNKSAALSPDVALTVLRNGSEIALTVTPHYVEGSNPYKIGISLGTTTLNENPRRLSLPEAFTYSCKIWWSAATAVFDGLKALTTTREGIDQLSGPVGIVTIISESTRTYGASAFIQLLIMFSVNLGLMNLLPIPGLDGSRIIFMLVEAVRGKPIAPRKEAVVHLVGFALLFGLMILLTYKDVTRLITGG